MKRGFTTVEILVVMGILLLLAGMLFVGAGYVMKSTRAGDTRTMLENARSLVAEFEATTSLNRLYQPYIDDGYNLADPLPSPASVRQGGADRDGEIVHITHEVMTILMQMPANRSAIEGMPPGRLLKDDDGLHGPVLLDGWGNPIIFVIPTGLSGVAVGDSVKTVADQTRRPFFASAGPDGDFSTGDDNIYSIDQVRSID